ncbi:MAG: TauD/TfdA family dioxygenase [Alphaproteobacteria bacterium]|nr:TauD/TfdA family dioxygenase [Alphaproteobacteria bacterium]
MGIVPRQRVNHPSAWKASDFTSPSDYVRPFTPRHLAAFDEALAVIHRDGRSLYQVDRQHFAVPALAEEIAGIRQEIVDGRGFVMYRGFPVDRYTQADIEMIFWGFGLHLGIAQSQSVLGERLGHIVDMTATDPHARAYRNKMELTLHTDLCDAIGMFSLRKAPKGGMSLLASALAVYNEILEKHPEDLDVVFRGAPYHRMGEEMPGESSITPHDVPALSYCDSKISCRYVRELLDAGADMAGRPLTTFEKAAFDFFDATASRTDMCLRYVMEPGDMMFYSNWTVLHGRTAFENGPRHDQKRHILRLWLDMPGSRPVVPETAIFGVSGVGYQEGKTPSVDLDRYKRTIPMAPEDRIA